MFECDNCRKVFKTKRAMSSHRTKVHNPVVNARIRKNQKAAQSKPETRARHSKA